jgi:hypothetical protein
VTEEEEEEMDPETKRSLQAAEALQKCAS